MILRLLLLGAMLPAWVPAPSSAPLATGIAKHYLYDSTFRQVLHNRGMLDRRGTYGITGLASTKRCSRVDTQADPTLKTNPWLVVISLWDGTRQQWSGERVLQVADCSDPIDLPRHEAIGLMVEVDPATAKATHFYRNGKTPVRVLDFWRYTDWKGRH